MKIMGKKVSLATQVFLAMLLGAVFGLAIGKPMTQLGFIGRIWLNGINLIIVPMILVTIVTGIISQKNLKALGRISGRILTYYIITTLVASVVGIVVATLLRPGHIANFTGLASQKIAAPKEITIADFFLNMFSPNMFRSFTEGNILQTLVIAVLLGISVLRMKDAALKTTVMNGFHAFSEMVFSLIGIVMMVSPVGIFFLMADSFAKYGAGIFTSMATLTGTYYLACLLHTVVVYGSLLWAMAGINPFKFLKDSAELWVYTISTCSSVASIPVNLKVAREKFGVSDTISGFTIPLGSQINYDGSVILYG